MLHYDPSEETGFLYLFDESARDAARKQLPDDICRLVAEGGDSIKIHKFYEAIYNQTPAHSDDIHDAIIDNPDLEVLTPKGRLRWRPRGISADDTLRLKAQPSFYLPGPANGLSKEP